MTRKFSPLGVAALLLGASQLPAAPLPAPAPSPIVPQARITLVEHNSTAGVNAAAGKPSADPSIRRRATPGMAAREAHVFLDKIAVGTSRTETLEVTFHSRSS